MTADPRGALRRMLERFISGDDRSLRYTNEIEESLNQHFRGEPVYGALIEDLATYRPGGGEFLVDEEHLTRRFEYAIDQWLRDARP